MKPTQILGVRETAQRLGCTLKYVYDLLYSGRLEGRKAGKQWCIRAEAIEARLKANKANGR